MLHILCTAWCWSWVCHKKEEERLKPRAGKGGWDGRVASFHDNIQNLFENGSVAGRGMNCLMGNPVSNGTKHNVCRTEERLCLQPRLLLREKGAKHLFVTHKRKPREKMNRKRSQSMHATSSRSIHGRLKPCLTSTDSLSQALTFDSKKRSSNSCSSKLTGGIAGP